MAILFHHTANNLSPYHTSGTGKLNKADTTGHKLVTSTGVTGREESAIAKQLSSTAHVCEESPF